MSERWPTMFDTEFTLVRKADVPPEVWSEFQQALDDYIQAWTENIQASVEEYDKVTKDGTVGPTTSSVHVNAPIGAIEPTVPKRKKKSNLNEEFTKSNDCHDPHNGQFCSGGSSLSADEQKAVSAYTNVEDADYQVINAAARRNEHGGLVGLLDKAIAKGGELKAALHCYRGGNMKTDPSQWIGKEMTISGFQSVSTSKSVATDFVGAAPNRSFPVLYELEVAQGTPALHVPGNESEVLLPRNLRLKISAVDKTPDHYVVKGRLATSSEVLDKVGKDVSDQASPTTTPLEKSYEEYVPPQEVQRNSSKAVQTWIADGSVSKGSEDVMLLAKALATGTPMNAENLQTISDYLVEHYELADRVDWPDHGAEWQEWFGMGGRAGLSWTRKCLKSVAKFNPNHDPATGRFSSGEEGSSAVHPHYEESTSQRPNDLLYHGTPISRVGSILRSGLLTSKGNENKIFGGDVEDALGFASMAAGDKLHPDKTFAVLGISREAFNKDGVATQNIDPKYIQRVEIFRTSDVDWKDYADNRANLLKAKPIQVFTRKDVAKFNQCHNPSGEGGGQFCSTGGSVSSVDSHLSETEAHALKQVAEAYSNKEVKARHRTSEAQDAGDLFTSAIDNRSDSQLSSRFARDKDGKVIGAVLWHKTSNNYIYVDALAAHPDIVAGKRRARGVGTSLMQHVASVAASLGAGVKLTSLQKSEPFYKKLGMHQDPNTTKEGRLHDFQWEPDEVKMFANVHKALTEEDVKRMWEEAADQEEITPALAGTLVRKSNDCHNPPGEDGGQFCSEGFTRGGGGGWKLPKGVNRTKYDKDNEFDESAEPIADHKPSFSTKEAILWVQHPTKGYLFSPYGGQLTHVSWYANLEDPDLPPLGKKFDQAPRGTISYNPGNRKQGKKGTVVITSYVGEHAPHKISNDLVRLATDAIPKDKREDYVVETHEGLSKKYDIEVEFTMQEDTVITGTISKVDKSKHQVFGWASIVEVDGQPLEDRQGDIMTSDDLEHMAYNFVLDCRKAGEMHQRSNNIGKLIESIVFTQEKQTAMGIDLGQVGWWVGFHIDDPDVWAKVEDGTYKAFSIHGKGIREKIER